MQKGQRVVDNASHNWNHQMKALMLEIENQVKRAGFLCRVYDGILYLGLSDKHKNSIKGERENSVNVCFTKPSSCYCII